MVDLGSGLGHLPCRVMQRLDLSTLDITSVAVEADADLHCSALKMDMKCPDPERRPIRLLACVEKEGLNQLMDE